MAQGDDFFKRMFVYLNEKVEDLEKQQCDLNRFVQEQTWNNQRLTKLYQQKKCHVVFVCHRPSVWVSLQSIYEKLLESGDFEVTIVAIPSKKQLPDLYFNHQVYIDEGAYEFFKNFPGRIINGYAENSWCDLKSLRPDYIFFQTPYNCIRPPEYQSPVVSSYTKIAYVHYGILLFRGDTADSVHPVDFMQDLSFMFCETQQNMHFVEKIYEKINNHTNVSLTVPGYTRFDLREKYRDAESMVWNYKKSNDKFRILWTPRWCTEEGVSHFFEYKDKFIEFCDAHEGIDFVFRPHPQHFLEAVGKGEMTQQDVEEYKAQYARRENMNIDSQPEYMDTFFSSDVLISDTSSIFAEYLMTDRPVIYTHRVDLFNEVGAKLAEAYYWVNSWDELVSVLAMLKGGRDPLKEKRREILADCFGLPLEGAGQRIAESLKKDFYLQS